MKKFWKWQNQTIQSQTTQEESQERLLRLEGEISSESWLGDEVTPKLFRDELMSGDGDISVIINSPGGDVFAAASIYNMLMDYPHKVTVKIDSLAASAASVIAMAGTTVQMSPVAMMMCHNPSTLAFGEKVDMEKAIAMLDEVKESIINAYEIKSGLSRVQLSHMMDAETWMDAKKAVKLGFADEIIGQTEENDETEAMLFTQAKVVTRFTNSISERCQLQEKETKPKTKAADLKSRLFLIKNWRN
ncbi:MAG: Clp protease ClpP [Streptococcaceae bacterium]|nr:Clp protease ClpP [Streptococcaceae bacterium]